MRYLVRARVKPGREADLLNSQWQKTEISRAVTRHAATER